MKKTIILIGLLVILSGCTNLLGGRSLAPETKIKATDGIGILEARTVTNSMLPETYNYVILAVRNNAQGSQAKNVVASIENIKPFKIYECNIEQEPDQTRASVCNQYFDDWAIPYRQHKINSMVPDQEVQFFWNIKSPASSEIAGMSFTHYMYYLLGYEYTSTMTQTVAAISQNEYLEQSRQGPVTLSGTTTSSPGELKLESKTQQPLIFLEGGRVDFTLEFTLKNTGEGLIKPGTNITLAIKKDALTTIDASLAQRSGWRTYTQGGNFDILFPAIEYPELTQNIRKDLLILEIPANQLIGGTYSVVLPATFNTEGIYEPQKFLTFTAYISYSYQKEGRMTINVYPQE